MNRKLTIALVLVFAALVVYALVVQVPKDNAAANATQTVAPTTYLWTVRADQISGVHVMDHVSGQGMDLVKDAAGTWSLTQPGPQPAEQSLAASDVSGLMTLAVDGTITTSTDLASFGVLSPTMTVEVDLADGTKLKAAVGDKSPTGTDYYVLRAGESQVVLLSTAAQGTLASLVTAPPVVPPTDTPTAPTAGPGTPSETPLPTATVPVTDTATALAPAPTAGTPGAVATISLYGPTATATP